MNQIRDILNELRWKEGCNLSEVEIWYIHRGSLGNTRVVKGSNIIAIHKTFVETAEAMIPHHRIFRITYRDTILFERYSIA